MRRKINIFLGSSIKEFEFERALIENFIHNISDKFEEHYNVKLYPLLCENFDPVYTEERKQDEFNKKIRESDFCFFLFFTKVGKYTREEFEVATEQFCKTHKPKIYTYFKAIEEGQAEQSIYDFMEELDKTFNHYYGTFSHIDTVKLRILLSLKLQEMDFLELKVEGGKCIVDGEAVMPMDNVAEFANNRTLTELQQELKQTEEEYYALRPLYDENSTDADFYSKYSKIATRRQTLMDEIDQLQKLIFNVSLRMIKDDIHGEITTRQKEAYRLFELGDYEGCMAVLNTEEMDNDFLRAREKLKEQEQTVCKRYIKECKTRIDILPAITKYEGRFAEIEELYDKIIPIIFEMGIELDTARDYAYYLNKQNKDKKVLTIAGKLLNLYSDESSLASILNLMALSCKNMNLSEKAENYCLKAIEIIESIVKENPEQFNPNLAMSYGNAGDLYSDQNKPEKAEYYYLKAIKIYDSLANDDPHLFIPFLAGIYNNAGVFYDEQNKPEKAETYYLKAIKIRELLADENPERFNPDLAMSYSNAGDLYSGQNKPKKAEYYYLKAIEIRESIVKENPERFNPYLANSYNNMGVLYYEQGQPSEAEDYYLKAIKIRENLAYKEPNRFKSDLADSYNNIGALYNRYSQPEKAEEHYLKAIEIYENLVNKNPKRFNPHLASSCNNAGILYYCQDQFDKAEDHYLKAIRTYESLADENPERFKPDLATSYNNAGTLYNRYNQPEKAEEHYLKAIKIYESLADENPERFNSDLAMSYNNAGILYNEQKHLGAAEYYYQKAIETYESLADENPERFIPELAACYFNYGLLTNDSAIFKKALTLAKTYPDYPKCKYIIDILGK